jgi:hypothetical protein
LLININTILHTKNILIFFLSLSFSTFAQEVAVLKYNGGGDWYANPTAIPNLIEFSNKNIKTFISKNPTRVSAGSSDIFNFPIIFMTGHGNVFFTDKEANNLRQYLISGGFLHISDNYGLDKYIRPQLKKVFPKLELQEIPFTHPIFNQTFTFEKGIPKIHEHDKKMPQGFGLFFEGRLVCFYDYESDLSDGWEDPEVHNNSSETRLKALQMGSNIIEYAFKN